MEQKVIKKEKQIEKMARLIHLNYECPLEFAVGMAEFLYDEGYCRQSETAKDIFDDLDNYLKHWRSESIKRIKYDTTDYYKGKVCASDEMFWFLRNELKKKYLEE